MASDGAHMIHIEGSTEDLDRDWKRIRIACSRPGCVHGIIEGSPAKDMDRLVALLAEHHVVDVVAAPARTIGAQDG